MLHLLASIALTTAPLPSVLDLPQTTKCAFGTRCGECWNTGRKGIIVWDGKFSDCVPCGGLTASPDQQIANHEGLPGGREPKRKPSFTFTTNYTPRVA